MSSSLRDGERPGERAGEKLWERPGEKLGERPGEKLVERGDVDLEVKKKAQTV